MPRNHRTPGYCHHKPTNQAYVRLNGKIIYLGEYGTPESRADFDRIMAEYYASGRSILPQGVTTAGPSINEVLLAHWRHAEAYYLLPDGIQSDELRNIKHAIRPLKRLSIT